MVWYLQCDYTDFADKHTFPQPLLLTSTVLSSVQTYHQTACFEGVYVCTSVDANMSTRRSRVTDS